MRPAEQTRSAWLRGVLNFDIRLIVRGYCAETSTNISKSGGDFLTDCFKWVLSLDEFIPLFNFVRATPESDEADVLPVVGKFTIDSSPAPQLAATVAAILLAVYMRANITGPPFTKFCISNKLKLEKLTGVIENAQQEQPSFTAESTQLLEVANRASFWKASPLGNPDWKLGESLQSHVLDKSTELLSVDGEIPASVTRAAAYLAVAVNLLDQSIRRVEKGTALHTSVTWLSGHAYALWYRAFEKPALLLPVLFRGAILHPLEHLQTLGLFPETSPLLSISRQLAASASPDGGAIGTVEPPDCEASDALLCETTSGGEWKDPGAEAERWFGDVPPAPHGLRADWAVALADLATRYVRVRRPELAPWLLRPAAVLQGFDYRFDSLLGVRRSQQYRAVLQLVVRLKRWPIGAKVGDRVVGESPSAKPVSAVGCGAAVAAGRMPDANAPDAPEAAASSASADVLPALLGERLVTNADGQWEREEIVGHMQDGVRIIKHKDLDPTADFLELPDFQAALPENPEAVAEATCALSSSETVHLIGLASCLLASGAQGDSLRREQVRSVIERCLQAGPPRKCNQRNGNERDGETLHATLARLPYCLLSAALWIRCKVELLKSKVTLQNRGIQQMRAVFERAQFCATERGNQRFNHAQLLPTTGEAAHEVASILMRTGSPLSAADIFLDNDMYEDAAECLIAAGRKGQARVLLEKQLRQLLPNSDSQEASEPEPVHTRPTPFVGGSGLRVARILCCLGDLDGESTEFYDRAWEASGGRYGRAQRSRGQFFMRRQRYPEAIAAFRFALRLNPMFAQVWFNLGRCQIREGQLDAARTSFSRGVALEPEGFEMWGNLAALHFNCDSYPQAFVAVREALRRKPDSWQLWDNHTKIACALGNRAAVMQGVRKMIELGHAKDVDLKIFEFFRVDDARPPKTAQPAARGNSQASAGNSSVPAASLSPVARRAEIDFLSNASQYITAPELFEILAENYAAVAEPESALDAAAKALRLRLSTLPAPPWAASHDADVAPALVAAVQRAASLFQRWWNSSHAAASPPGDDRRREAVAVLEAIETRLSVIACQNECVLAAVGRAIGCLRNAEPAEPA